MRQSRGRNPPGAGPAIGRTDADVAVPVNSQSVLMVGEQINPEVTGEVCVSSPRWGEVVLEVVEAPGVIVHEPAGVRETIARTAIHEDGGDTDSASRRQHQVADIGAEGGLLAIVGQFHVVAPGARAFAMHLQVRVVLPVGGEDRIELEVLILLSVTTKGGPLVVQKLQPDPSAAVVRGRLERQSDATSSSRARCHPGRIASSRGWRHRCPRCRWLETSWLLPAASPLTGKFRGRSSCPPLWPHRHSSWKRGQTRCRAAR